MPHPSIPVAPQWRTVRTERTVLAVVHNVTAATRLLDVISLFAEDPRLQFVFTCPGSSAFTRGTEEFLAARGIPLLPWAEAVKTEFDWAVAASYGGDLHELRAPLTVVPHGMGYNKFLETGNGKRETGNGKRETVFGLSEPWLLHKGAVVPRHIVLSHHEQLERLRRSCPPAVDNAVVVGDPCLDRLRAARPLRETYRQALGVSPHRTMVLVSSTWGTESLFGQDPDLPRRLAATLPLDEFKVVLALHPNIHHGHQRWQVSQWLAEAERTGVVILPAEELWQPAVIAADVVVGDHGSVTFYGACLGTPVVLAVAPHHTVDPASPIAAMVRTAPRLEETDLATQLTAPGSNDLREITALATSAPGEAAERLTDLGYRTLALRAPDRRPRLTAFPVPRVDPVEPSAMWVSVRVDGRDVRIERRLADAPANAHFVVSTDGADLSELDRASVVLGGPTLEPARWIAITLASLPGCRWAGCPAPGGGWVAGDRERLVHVEADHGGAVVSVLHAWADAPAEFTLELGPEREQVRISPAPTTSRDQPLPR